MLLYGDIVKKVLEQEALPILRNAVDASLNARFGEEWYLYFARAIMEGYADFKKIDTFVSSGKGKAIEAMNIDAICYLVMPYDKDLGMYLDGAMPMLEEYYQLDAEPERLKRLRTINNNCMRDKLDADMDDQDQMLLTAGGQEKKWLLEIEKLLKVFAPELDLSSYWNSLEARIAGNMSQLKQQEGADMPDLEQVREAMLKVYPFSFAQAPVGEALKGAAPWAFSKEDLENLPWPSLEGKEKEKEDLSVFIKPDADEEEKTKEDKKVSLDEFIIQENASEQNGSEDGKPQEEAAAEEKSAESLDSQENADNSPRSKGVGKLFDWLKGKK